MPFEPRADPYHTVIRCWSWYSVQREGAQRLLNAIQAALSDGNPVDVHQFDGMTPVEFNTAASSHLQELEHLAAMNMFSAAEAGLWRDYRNKGRGKEATSVCTAMSALYAAEGFDLYDLLPVLNVWCDCSSGQRRQHFSDYKGALHYRHWLAHGRHWDLMGERYTLTKVFDICTNIVASIGD